AFAGVHRNTGGIPRQINRLCSRVLLYGALEERGVITALMVETTSRELQDDLNGAEAVHEPALPIAESGIDLARRLAALEPIVSRRERVFQRLIDLLSTHAVTAS